MHSNEFDFPSRKALWRENHGNFLIAFVVMILLIGGALLAYQQSRFVPPRFPDERMIQRPEAENPALAAATGGGGSAGVLTIRVSGAANEQGSVLVAVYDSQETFNDPKRAVAATTCPIVDGAAICTLPAGELPGRLAVAAFHDENGDAMLNRNAFGIPLERYGFSNDARGMTGPPKYEQAVIEGPFTDRLVPISLK